MVPSKQTMLTSIEFYCKFSNRLNVSFAVVNLYFFLKPTLVLSTDGPVPLEGVVPFLIIQSN